MTDATTDLMNRLTSEWMRACTDRDWYQAELAKAQQKIRDMLAQADKLQEITQRCERRANDRDAMAVELTTLKMNTETWFRGIHDLVADHSYEHSDLNQIASCVTKKINDLISHARRNAISDDDLLMRAVSEFEMSVRTANCLDNSKILLVGELVQKTGAELLRTKNFGRRSLKEIKTLLGSLGLELGTPIPDWNERIERWKQKQIGAGAVQ